LTDSSGYNTYSVTTYEMSSIYFGSNYIFILGNVGVGITDLFDKNQVAC